MISSSKESSYFLTLAVTTTSGGRISFNFCCSSGVKELGIPGINERKTNEISINFEKMKVGGDTNYKRTLISSFLFRTLKINYFHQIYDRVKRAGWIDFGKTIQMQ